MLSKDGKSEAPLDPMEEFKKQMADMENMMNGSQPLLSLGCSVVCNLCKYKLYFCFCLIGCLKLSLTGKNKNIT